MNTQAVELLKKTAVQSFWNTYLSEVDPFDGLVYKRPSTQSVDTYTRLGAAPMPEEWLGDLKYKAANEFSYSVENKRYRVGIRVGAKTVKFQQWDEVANLTGNLGAKARALPIKLLTTKLEAGFASTCEDGQFFFDTDHADPGAEYTTSQDNDLTSAGTPTDLQIATAIRAIKNSFRGRKDDRGDPFGLNPMGPSNLVIMVPPNIESVTNQVLVADSLTGPVGNDLVGQFDMRVNPRLTNAKYLYGFIQSVPHKPLILQEAGGVETFYEYDNTSGDFFMGAEWWGAVEFGNWRTAVGYIFT